MFNQGAIRIFNPASDARGESRNHRVRRADVDPRSSPAHRTPPTRCYRRRRWRRARCSRRGRGSRYCEQTVSPLSVDRLSRAQDELLQPPVETRVRRRAGTDGIAVAEIDRRRGPATRVRDDRIEVHVAGTRETGNAALRVAIRASMPRHARNRQRSPRTRRSSRTRVGAT